VPAISVTSSGSFKNTESFISKLLKTDIMSALNRYGQTGVAALSSATPAETGRTANSWTYEVERHGSVYSITWLNTHIVEGVSVAILLQYGHGTGTGGYVRGRDYINPAIKPIFDKIADEVWRVVTSA
jgi:hypothetical protein